MIVIEDLGALVRTYSDSGYKIKQDVTNIVYDEAIDPKDSGRTYTETREKRDDHSEVDINSEALELLNILLGGEEETPDEGGN